MQKQDATRVAGMYSWNQLGRKVRRGEKGIMIFAPMVSRRRKKEAEKQNEQQADVRETTTERNTDGKLVGFRPVYVWDVSQTEGAELPKLDEVQGNPAEQLP